MIKKTPEIFDLNTTTIENIFLDDFMLYAPEKALKLYLMVVRLLSKYQEIELKELKELLKFSQEELEEALSYWEEQGLLKRQRVGMTDEIRFISVRSLYIESNFDRKRTELSIDYNPYFQRLFDAVNHVIAVPLTELERQNLADFLKDKTVEEDVVCKAYDQSRRASRRTVRVIEKLRYWLENGASTLNDVLLLEERLNLRQLYYKRVLEALGRGYESPTAGDKECIDRWLDEFELGIDEIIDKITTITMRKSKPTMVYLDAAFRNSQKEQAEKPEEDDLKKMFRN
ncbi:hypothetical protein [Guggenheimella bovis]